MEFIKENNINYWPTPAESPNLNPIEMVRHELKHHIRKRVKPSIKDELVSGILEFWRTVDWQKCVQHIDHIQKVIPIIIEREGKASGH